MNGLVETEIGWLPAKWHVQRLGDVFETRLGKMLSQKAHVGNSPKPYLRNKNVQWGRIDVSDMLYMDFNERESEKFRLRAGDLLVCEGGEPGRAAIWNGALTECFYQKALHRLRPRDGRMLSEFMNYWLRFSFDLQNLYGVAGGSSTIAHIPEVQLKSLPIPVPPVSEQRKIAAVLGLVQRAIEQQERLIALTTELKKALLHKLFTEGLRREPQKQTEIGPVPESWELKQLGVYCDIVSSSMSYTQLSESESSTDADSVSVMGVKVSDMNLAGNENRFVSANLIMQLSPAVACKKAIPPNTIVFPKRGAAIATNKKRLTTTWTVLDPNLIGVRAKDGLDSGFLFHWLQTFDLRKITDPGPTPQLNKKDLSPILMPVPPDIGEQHEIARSLDQVDVKIKIHDRKRGIVCDLFRNLLHQLMTAQIRVHDLDLDEFLQQPVAEIGDGVAPSDGALVKEGQVVHN